MMISPWTQRPVDVDPYGPNPSLAALQVENPAVYKLAIAGGPAPTMFVGGDLPAFTASGLDPAILNSFPWQMRHGAAAEPSAAVVYGWLEKFAEDDSYDIPHGGLHAFNSRINLWARESKAPSTPIDMDATYEGLFGTEGAK
jgi:hypothetical protein